MDGSRPSFKTGLVGHGLEELYRCRCCSDKFTFGGLFQPTMFVTINAVTIGYQPSCFKACPKS
jgi:hypothetical protein